MNRTSPSLLQVSRPTMRWRIVVILGKGRVAGEDLHGRAKVPHAGRAELPRSPASAVEFARVARSHANPEGSQDPVIGHLVICSR